MSWLRSSIGGVVLIEDEPVIPLGPNKHGRLFSRFLDCFIEVFIWHGFVIRGSQEEIL